MARTRAQINARNRAAGKRWEADCLSGLRAEGFDSERPRTAGALDEGDLVVRHNGAMHVFELKNTKTWSYRIILDYIRQAKVEAENFGKRRNRETRYAALLKVHGKGFHDGLVVMPVSEYLKLLKGDQQ